MLRPVAIAALVALAALAGCGDDYGGGSERSPEETAEAYVEARSAGDAEAVCDLTSDSYKDLVAGDPDNPEGQSCEEIERAVGPSEEENEVTDVQTSGDEGVATVTCEDSTASDCSLPLLREDGEWRVDGGLSPND